MSVAITFQPAQNSIYPSCCMKVDISSCFNVGQLRKKVALRYYVEEKYLMMIYKGKVLKDDVQLQKLGLNNEEKISISIDCPQQKDKLEKEKRTEQVAHLQSQTPIPPKGQISQDKRNQPAHSSTLVQRKSAQDEDEDNQMSFNQYARKLFALLNRSSTYLSLKTKESYSVLKQKYSKQIQSLKESSLVNQRNEQISLKLLSLARGNVDMVADVLTTMLHNH